MDKENNPNVLRTSRVPGMTTNKGPRPPRPSGLVSAYLYPVLEIRTKDNEK